FQICVTFVTTLNLIETFCYELTENNFSFIAPPIYSIYHLFALHLIYIEIIDYLGYFCVENK
ncbi:MAG: hypothetical protein KJ666_14320, partial [Bacteroidetes bacterium]|nr:hypothetical protein [Bacteroidota bacterium]